MVAWAFKYVKDNEFVRLKLNNRIILIITLIVIVSSISYAHCYSNSIESKNIPRMSVECGDKSDYKVGELVCELVCMYEQ